MNRLFMMIGIWLARLLYLARIVRRPQEQYKQLEVRRHLDIFLDLVGDNTKVGCEPVTIMHGPDRIATERKA